MYGRTDEAQWGEDNIEQILSGLTGDGSDIIDIKPRCRRTLGCLPLQCLPPNLPRRKPGIRHLYRRYQSGLQLLSSSLREASLATNVITSSVIAGDRWMATGELLRSLELVKPPEQAVRWALTLNGLNATTSRP